jgi:hypothetical protein
MKRLLAVTLALSLLLAGCLGTPVSTGDADPTPIEPDEIPGVSDGTLSNATALASANHDRLAAAGAEVRTVRRLDGNTVETGLGLSANASTFVVTRTASGDRRLDVWGNRSSQTMRVDRGSETRYRVVERRGDRLETFDSLERMVARGAFAVNRTTSNGTAVLTTNTIDSSRDSAGAGPSISSFEATLVVRESGVIERLAVELARDDHTTEYTYELVETGIDSLERPAWLGDVPPSASLHPEIRIDVVNETHLRLANEGDDPVPADTTLSLRMNETEFQAQFTESLEGGDQRYVYLDPSGNELRLSDQRPGPEYATLYSPISVSLTTDDGVSLYSASFGWDSATASASGGSTSSGTSR